MIQVPSVSLNSNPVSVDPDVQFVFKFKFKIPDFIYVQFWCRLSGGAI
jgi:hypothetical protein